MTNYEKYESLYDTSFLPPHYSDGSNCRSKRFPQNIPVLDYQWTASNPLDSSIILQQGKNFERVQQWLSQQNEYARVPPPEDESLSSLRSNSAVDVTSNNPSPIDEFNAADFFPKYKSEEHIENLRTTSNDLLKFSGIELRRYYSPNLIRRRRYSPRSDPTLNKTNAYTSKEHSSHNKQMISKLDQRKIVGSPLNKYFYNSGKGNTFPRRNKFTTESSSQLNLLTPPRMGQQMEKYRPLSYDERVMPNPYASDVLIHSENVCKQRPPRPTSLLEGRSFVLNGISTQSKHDASSGIDKSSSLISNMSLDTQRLLTGNLGNIPDVALTAAKAIHKRELSDSLPKFQLRKEPSHIRVSSAPEPNTLDKEQVLLRDGVAKRVPPQIRKVKAFSWPKRAVLPSYTDLKIIDNEGIKISSLNKTESGYNTEKSEDKNENIRQDIQDMNLCDDKNCCNQSDKSDDIPPVRPPLPAERSYIERTFHSTGHPQSRKPSSVGFSHTSEVEKIDRTLSTQPIHEQDNLGPVHWRHRSQVSNGSFSSHNDLSKTVSMSLKDLIRIHEQEIARVSAGISSNYKGIDHLYVKSRKSSLLESKCKQKKAWKRHTTIGLLTSYDDDQHHNLQFTEHRENASEAETSPVRSPRDDYHLHSDNDHVCTDKLTNIRIFTDKSTNIRVSDKSKQTRVSLSSEHLITSSSSDYVTDTWSPHGKKRDVPPTLPKRAEPSSGTVVVEPSYINVNSAREQFEYLTSPTEDILKSVESKPDLFDASVQTETHLTRSLSFKKNEERVQCLIAEKEEMSRDFDMERELLHKRLEEQKKVANAYQKLEDRYRRKVYELQKAMRMCACAERSRVCSPDSDRSYIIRAPNHHTHSALLNEDNHDMSVQKVDGILHQLEAWLNHQTNGIPTDTSEISSVIGSITDEVFPRYKLTSEQLASPPLEIIDKIDATSV